MAANVVTCPECQAKLKVPQTAAGKRVRCLKCQELFEVDARPDTAGAYQLQGGGEEKRPQPVKRAPRSRRSGGSRPVVIRGQVNVLVMLFMLGVAFLAFLGIAFCVFEIGHKGWRAAQAGRLLLLSVSLLIGTIGQFIAGLLFQRAKPRLILSDDFIKFVMNRKVVGKIPYSNIHCLEEGTLEEENRRVRVLFITLTSSDDPSTFWPPEMRRGGYDPFITPDFKMSLGAITDLIEERC